MSFVSNLFSSSQGAGYTPSTTPLLQTTNPNQLQTAQTGTQSALGQQQAFLNALQGQNGVGNQSSVFNQLQGVANGAGPNPAQAMLNQATGQNIANQSALMAGQRGASANPALIARQAAQQGAATQQNAVGQGAALQANQSLGALGQLGGIAGQQVGQQAGALGTLQNTQLANQGQQLGAAGQLNQQNLQQQQGINQIQGTQALSNQGFQQGVVGGVANGLGGAASSAAGGGGGSGGIADLGAMALNQGGKIAKAPRKMAAGGPTSTMTGGGYSPTNDLSTIANDPANIPGGGTLNGLSAMQNNPQVAQGVQAPAAPPIDPTKPQSRVGQQLSPGSAYSSGSQAGGGLASGIGKLFTMMAHGGKVDALVSPGEKFLKPTEAKAVASGRASPQAVGEMIPGHAKVNGDSLKNDTVPKKLEEGGVVIPRTVMQRGPKHAHAFVAAVMARSPSDESRPSHISGFHKL